MRNVTYAIRDIVVEGGKLRRQGKKILPLNIGDPLKYDFETPRHIIDAVNRAMLDGFNGYSNSLGDEEAREAVAKSAREKGMNCTADDIQLTAGGSEGIHMALSSLVNEGENILMPRPGYPQYAGILNLLEAGLNPYDLDEWSGWKADAGDIEEKINKKTKGIVIINPNNPTGSVTDKKILKEIVNLAGQHDLVLLSDETYDELVFGEKMASTAAVAGEVPTVVFNTLSKSYLVPGWRTGWTIFHDPDGKIEDYKEAVFQLARLRLCSTHPMQFAIKAALEGPKDHIEDMKRRLRKRRDFTHKRLNEIKGLSCAKPEGAFYAFPSINLRSVKSDKDFVVELLRETGVMTVYGVGFTEKPGTRHFRTVFLPPVDLMSEAFDKIEEFIKKKY
jgi:alanine-synthesizing transaminase